MELVLNKSIIMIIEYRQCNGTVYKAPCTDYEIHSMSLCTEEPEESRFPITPVGPPVETLKLEVKKVQLMFEVENLDYHVPTLCIKAAVEASLYDWSKQVGMWTVYTCTV